ncbi:MAG: hypothetical protein OXI18_04890 [bacterium]|nr:hypothetical protein [bacterium]
MKLAAVALVGIAIGAIGILLPGLITTLIESNPDRAKTYVETIHLGMNEHGWWWRAKCNETGAIEYGGQPSADRGEAMRDASLWLQRHC